MAEDFNTGLDFSLIIDLEKTVSQECSEEVCSDFKSYFYQFFTGRIMLLSKSTIFVPYSFDSL